MATIMGQIISLHPWLQWCRKRGKYLRRKKPITGLLHSADVINQYCGIFVFTSVTCKYAIQAPVFLSSGRKRGVKMYLPLNLLLRGVSKTETSLMYQKADYRRKGRVQAQIRIVGHGEKKIDPWTMVRLKSSPVIAVWPQSSSSWQIVASGAHGNSFQQDFSEHDMSFTPSWLFGGVSVVSFSVLFYACHSAAFLIRVFILLIVLNKVYIERFVFNRLMRWKSWTKLIYYIDLNNRFSHLQ